MPDIPVRALNRTMGLDEVTKLLSGEWEAISKTPLAFLAAVAVVGFLTWKLVQREFQTRLSNLQSKLDLSEAKVKDYEQKLAGASPDEAKARMDSLQKQIDALRQTQRLLSPYQKDLIAKAVAGISLEQYSFDLIYPLPSQEAATYAHDFAEAFQAGGWNVIADTMMSGHRIKRTGICLGVPDPTNLNTIAQAVSNGLKGAGVQFSVEADNHRNHARLYIDMA